MNELMNDSINRPHCATVPYNTAGSHDMKQGGERRESSDLIQTDASTSTE